MANHLNPRGVEKACRWCFGWKCQGRCDRATLRRMLDTEREKIKALVAEVLKLRAGEHLGAPTSPPSRGRKAGG